nr:hypothetical protein BaRGS_028201 [Batillaria attramentaria]
MRIPELRVLWEAVSGDHQTVADTASRALVELVMTRAAHFTYVINGFLTGCPPPAGWLKKKKNKNNKKLVSYLGLNAAQATKANLRLKNRKKKKKNNNNNKNKEEEEQEGEEEEEEAQEKKKSFS